MKIILLLFCFGFNLSGFSQQKYTPQSGDLLFQDIDCGPFCDAIEKVTTGIGSKSFSHLGIVYNEDNVSYVIEAGGRGVVKTLLDSFLLRSSDEKGQPKVIAGRVKKKYRYIVPFAIQKSLSLLGKKYDDGFDIQNDSYYCSELVYYAFVDSAGKSLFELSPMTFIDPDTKSTFPAWTQYFNDLGISIPEGKPGLNPGGISRSNKIEIVYRYY